MIGRNELYPSSEIKFHLVGRIVLFLYVLCSQHHYWKCEVVQCQKWLWIHHKVGSM